MDNPLDDLDHLSFAVLPYVAAVFFVVLVGARRYQVPPFGTAPTPPPIREGRPYHGERLLFGYGILVIVAGHILAFLIPEQVLLWNNDPVRLYVLEASALVFALMTLVGLVLTVARCSINPEARKATRPSDWFLYVLLLLQVGSGIGVALFYAWGSSWYATSVVPYLRSVFRLDPDLSYISAMPHLVKLHVVNAYVLLAFLPFTPLVRPLVARPAEEGQDRGRSNLTTALLLVGLGVSLLALVPRLQSTHLPGNDEGYEPMQPIAFSHRLHAGELQVSCQYCHTAAEKGRHAGIPAASVCMNCHTSVTAPLRVVRAEFERTKQQKPELAALGASTLGLIGSPLNHGPLLAASVLYPGRPEKRFGGPVISAELGKLYAALGLNNQLKPDPAKHSRPIRWVKVHNLPAFVRFDHRAHVNVGVTCQHCHGAVETMERVRQVENLSMGWCVNCHRDANRHGVAGKQVHASNDCSACHH